jgi:predicted Zn-dependent protease
MDFDLFTQALERCEGYCDLGMFNEAWEQLEALPTELKQDVGVLTSRMQILMGLKDHQKASYIGLTLVEQFPEKLGVLLSTAECLIQCKDHQDARRLLTNGLTAHHESPDLWLTLARVECLLGDNEKAGDCVKEYMARNPEAKLAVLDISELDSLW